jgi:hypothetical protein
VGLDEAPAAVRTPRQSDAAVLERQRREWEASRQPVDGVTGLRLYLRVLRGMALQAH